ncbi:hypothetical protein [Streptomyces sp. Ag109_O5-1]|uniref:hypothetical protein n=1 Tax=Streptomyces sp. Ag109_O5-1 TaxID=1938851 RepID=UPI000F4FC484|nr:hypothetical protein [Streptomyces sp. Ag109_O5-1]
MSSGNLTAMSPWMSVSCRTVPFVLPVVAVSDPVALATLRVSVVAAVSSTIRFGLSESSL